MDRLSAMREQAPETRTVATSCPSRDEFLEYVRGGCTLEESAAIAAHLAACENCAIIVEEMIPFEPPPPDPTATQPVPAGGPVDPNVTRPMNGGVSGPAPSAHPPVIGNYEINRKLSQGGQAVVYLAKHAGTKRLVALKVLPSFVSRNPEFLRRFRREAALAAKLDHPNIVRVYDSGVAKGLYYIALEYVEGQTLTEMLEHGPLSELQLIEIALALLEALDHAHGHRVLHRDVKPGNVLVTRTGVVKLTDFGLAKFETTDTVQTTEGTLIGTPAYISPEQTYGRLDIDPRSDLYSLGSVIFHMATGRPPFQGESWFDVIDQHRRVEPPSIQSLNPNISPALDAVVLRALSKRPERRHQTAREMAHDLRQVREAVRVLHDTHGDAHRLRRAREWMELITQRIQASHERSGAPGWQMRLTAAFLRRPMAWLGLGVALSLAAAALALWIGIRIGARWR
jgi:serine/threonine protein kinase